MESLSEAKIAKIVFQIAQGLEYLHSQGIAHCDLKLSNLLTQKGQIVTIISFRKYVILDSAEESMKKFLETSAGRFFTWLPK